MIYLDNAATTKMSPTVLEAMQPYLTDKYGNPSSIYDLGSRSRDAIDEAREIIANSIGAQPSEIFFTSGGTESDNWAIKELPYLIDCECPSIYTTQIEHPAIMNSCADCGNFYISKMPVDEYGTVKLEEFKSEEYVHLVSVMFANNEIGTIQPIKEVGEVADQNNVLFHTDAVQAYGHIPINVNEYKIDMMSASAHKLNGPKGVGFLYVRNGFKKSRFSFISGGEQEDGRRAGTENVAGIVGFGQAVKEAMENMDERAAYETELRDYLISRVLNEIPNTRLNGHPTNRLPNNANFSFGDVEGESIAILLNEAGICVSTGSACSSQNSEPSHVLKAIGLSDEMAYSSVRMTLSHENTYKEIDTAVDKLIDVVSQLRSIL